MPLVTVAHFQPWAFQQLQAAQMRYQTCQQGFHCSKHKQMSTQSQVMQGKGASKLNQDHAPRQIRYARKMRQQWEYTKHFQPVEDQLARSTTLVCYCSRSTTRMQCQSTRNHNQNPMQYYIQQADPRLQKQANYAYMEGLLKAMPR